LAAPAAPAPVVPSVAEPSPEIVAQLCAHPGQLKDFYATRGFRPLWATDGGIGPEANALIGFLSSADIEGLKPSSYKPRDLQWAV
jgi:hypothetical protein